MTLFDFVIEEGVQDVLWGIIIEAAVIIVYFVADKGVVGEEQCFDYIHLLLTGDTENEPLIHLTDIPVAGNRVSGIGYIIKGSFGNVRSFDEVFADLVDVVAVIDVSQIIYFGNRGSAECVYYGRPLVFCFPCDIINQASGKK